MDGWEVEYCDLMRVVENGFFPAENYSKGRVYKVSILSRVDLVMYILSDNSSYAMRIQ